MTEEKHRDNPVFFNAEFGMRNEECVYERKRVSRF